MKILNSTEIKGSLTTNAVVQDNRLTTGNKQLVNASSSMIYVGNPQTNLTLESSSNPGVNVGGKTYALYHAGNKPTAADVGALASGANAVSASKLQTARTIKATGDATGSTSFDGSADKTIALTLANSGVTSGSYGPTANSTASFSGTFTIPQITVDAKGRVTSAATRTITMPANPNSDTKVTNTLATTTKAYVTGTTSSSTNTGTQVFDTGVYLDTTAGRLVATTFAGALSGNASTATKLATARSINGTNFDGTSAITTAKWGTARSITLGRTSKSIDGSSNVTYTLPEIMGYCSTTSSGNATYTNKWTKFASIDLSSGAYKECSGQFIFTSKETDAFSGILQFYLRTNSEISSVTISLRWATLTNVNYASNVVAVKTADGKFDLYFKPIHNYTIMGITALCQNVQYLTLHSAQSYVDSVTASSTSSLMNYASALATSRKISATGDVTGSTTFNGSADVSMAMTLANSGVTAGSYGPTANTTASFGGTFTIPQVTVDAKGRVTSATTRTITMPANPNSDTKVTNTLATTTKAYVTGTTSATTNTGTQVFDTGVYLDTTAGKLVATTFQGALSGNASTSTKATQDSEGQQINKTYIKGLSVSGKTITYTKGDGTTGTITTQDTNTTYSVGTASSLGLTKLYTGTGTATDGTMTQSAINTALSGKANSSHTHDYAPTSHTHSSLAGTNPGTVAPTTGTGVLRYDYNISSSVSGVFPNTNNANGILTVNTHAGNYYNQLGFSSNGNLYHRSFNGVALDTTTAWKQIAYTDSTVANATKATQDSAGQPINTTYIKGLSVSGRTITYTKGDGTTGTITTQDTNTTYSTGTASTSGLTKLYTGTGTATDGTMTQAAINTALSGKANSSHGTHVPSTCNTITDWNSATTTGWYMASGATNAPTADAWYFGEVIAHNTNYLIQTVYQFTASTDAKAIPKYIRAKMNGTWGSWTNVTVAKAVPSNAVFTDTNTWRGVQDNLTSTATDQSLSANQGKVLKGLIDGKAASSHTHNYAGSSSAGGAANSATVLATARKINGTSFNGSADITTANWGTARTLTIGSTGKSVNGSANVSWSLSEIGAAAASHNHDSSYFKKHLGSVTDFNKCLTEGQYSYGTDALNTPIKGYGTLIVYVNDGGTHDNSSNWIWQLAYTTGTNENYIRQKVNSGGWTPWVRLTLPAYDNAWNDGYVRTRPDGVTAVGKYLDFYPTSGGSYSRLHTEGSYLQFKGSKVGLMNVGTAAPTTSTCPVGFIYGQY